MATLAEIAKVLGTTEQKVAARIAGMKLGPACGRCGGCGRYSWNQISGDTCFGCNGTGHRQPGKRELAATLKRAEEAVANGELETYLKRLEDARFVKNGHDKVFALWRATNAAKNNPHHCKRDHELTPYELSARRANRLMSEACSEWEKICYTRKDASEKAAVLHDVLARIAAADIPE